MSSILGACVPTFRVCIKTIICVSIFTIKRLARISIFVLTIIAIFMMGISPRVSCGVFVHVLVRRVRRLVIWEKVYFSFGFGI